MMSVRTLLYNKLLDKDFLIISLCMPQKMFKLFIPFEATPPPTHTSESIASVFFFIHLLCHWLFCSSSFKFMKNQIIKLECYLPLILKYMQQSGYSWQWLGHQWAAWKQTETLTEEKILDSCCIHFRTFEVLEHRLLPSEARCSLK